MRFISNCLLVSVELTTLLAGAIVRPIKMPAAMQLNAECRFGRKLSEAFGCAGGIQNGICVKALLVKADAIISSDESMRDHYKNIIKITLPFL
ncbi:hypothetical protein QZN30_22165 [Burkholderia multivorans]|nr:hypothetical protein [Burkholderia multivorans]